MEKTAYLPNEACICISLRRIAQKATEVYDRALQPLGVSVNQYSLLVNICRKEGCGTGELAKRVRLEKSTLVRTLQPLLRDGLIVDKASGTKRQRRLYLSDAGRDVLKKAFPLWCKAQEAMATELGMSHDDRMALFQRMALWN